MTVSSLRRGLVAALILAGSTMSPVIAQERKAIPATPLLPPDVAAKLKQIDDERRGAAAKRADIYDSKADARALIASATAQAKKDNKRVLVMFGGNWCGWCHKLHALLKSDPQIRRTMLYEYELVLIDTEAPNAQAVIRKYDAKIQGVPYLLVLDGDGKLVTQRETGGLEEGDHHDPKKVLAFLDQWKAPALDARQAWKFALAEAASRDKLVFLHFGAPWCGWCHRLEDFLAGDTVAEILGRQFVDLKIDTDRMTGGQEMLDEFKAGQKGIPWFAFVDRDGKVVTDSDGPEGNVGYPVKPVEIAHFIGMLRKAATRLTPDQIGRIEAELKAAAEKILANQ
jgi:thiol-disulfide isomerase/thioredoxin